MFVSSFVRGTPRVRVALYSLKPQEGSRNVSSPIWLLTIKTRDHYHRRHDRRRKEPHGQVEGQLHDFVSVERSQHQSHKSAELYFEKPTAGSAPHPLSSLLVVVEDVNGPGDGHEPHEPAHVCGQRAQFTQVQPEQQRQRAHASAAGARRLRACSV